MKNLSVLILLIFTVCFVKTSSLQAQTNQKIKEETILVNENNNVYLFFSSPIKTGIAGSESAVFVYNTKQKENIGILKGKNGCNTNLMIITDDGSIFSFIVKYQKTITKFNYFYNNQSSINNLNKLKGNKTVLKSSDNNENENGVITENSYDTVGIYSKNNIGKEKDFEKMCKAVINDGIFFRRFTCSNNMVELKLNNLEYKNDYFYFFMTIKNNTNIDYDVNFTEFYISTKKKKLRSSAQKIMYKPDYIFNNPKRIKGKTSEQFVYVIKKFTVSNNKVLIIDINELKGERNLSLEINAEIINNPN